MGSNGGSRATASGTGLVDDGSRSTFTVFAQHRAKRLVLRRGLTSIADARAFAESMRAQRFHDHKAVFIVHDPSGTVVDEAALAELSEPAIPLPVPAAHVRRSRTAEEVLAAARRAHERFSESRARLHRHFDDPATAGWAASLHAAMLDLERHNSRAIASLESVVGRLRRA